MVNARHVGFALIALAFAAANGCKPDVAGRPSLVDSERVLAVRSEPAEAKPGDAVQYTALYVGPDGNAKASDLDWSLCVGRKPLAASGPVTEDCLRATGKLLGPLGGGASVKAAVPDDTCRLFGPTPPAPEEGQPAVRPADPDTTGGYYQPVRLRIARGGADDEYIVGVTRITCGLNGATTEQADAYAVGYRTNENPVLDSLALVRNGKETNVVPGTAAKVAPSEHLTLRVHWAACPTKSTCGDGLCGAGETIVTCADDCTMPVGCSGSEPYVYFDPVARAVRPRRESMRVSWFANDGRFEQERTGRGEKDAENAFSENRWTAPSKPGEVLLWVVLRDDRGGVGFASYKLQVGI